MSPVQIRSTNVDSGVAQAELQAKSARPAAGTVDVEAAAAEVVEYYADRSFLGAHNVGYVHVPDPFDPGGPAVSQARQERFAASYQAAAAQVDGFPRSNKGASPSAVHRARSDRPGAWAARPAAARRSELANLIALRRAHTQRVECLNIVMHNNQHDHESGAARSRH